MRWAFVTLAAFVAGLAIFAMRGGDAPARPIARPVLTGTTADIGPLQKAITAGRNDLRPALAAAYMQKVRETADASFYARAEGVLGTPRTPEAFAVAGELALARHDFSRALGLGGRAGADGAPVRVDALVELGRYPEASRELQAMIDAKPNLSGYARASYLRELHGDLRGAESAMRLAVAAGGPSAENVAYVQELLGELLRRTGDRTGARRAFEQALARVPGHPASVAGLARLDAQDAAATTGRGRGRPAPAAARRDFARAIARLRPLAARLPLPEYVIALGEDELAAGREAAAKRDLSLVGAEEQLLRAAGVDVDVELAVFEADHGDPARAVSLAQRGWANAPSVRSADAMGWALTQSGDRRAGLRWARKALALGSVDPLWLAHAGLAAPHTKQGREWLRAAFAHGLAGWPWQAERARRALR